MRRATSKRFLLVALLVSQSCRTSSTPAPATGPASDIAMLASRPFGGRYPGTPGGDSAAAFIMHRYAELGLIPAFRGGCDAGPPCGPLYLQVFPFERSVAQNVGAIVAGTDSVLRAEYIVIGAHFDHLGASPKHAFDPQHGFMARPGADDNASGTAAVLELARRFASHPIRRSIVVVNFDAEEEGLLGSRAFVEHLPVPKRAIVLMLNFDMIGRLRADRVFVEGVAEHSAARLAVDRAAGAVGIRPDFIHDRELSDHSSFLAQGIEVVALSTGEDADYHTTTDVAAHVNMDGVARVIDFAEAIVRQRDARYSEREVQSDAGETNLLAMELPVRRRPVVVLRENAPATTPELRFARARELESSTHAQADTLNGIANDLGIAGRNETHRLESDVDRRQTQLRAAMPQPLRQVDRIAPHEIFTTTVHAERE
jgi:hypothetical protein